jgi:hypothetical protein
LVQVASSSEPTTLAPILVKGFSWHGGKNGAPRFLGLQEMAWILLSFLVFGPYGNIAMAAFDNKSPSVADAVRSVGLEIDLWVMAGAKKLSLLTVLAVRSVRSVAGANINLEEDARDLLTMHDLQRLLD